MGKKLLIVMTAVFCISSAALGYMGYQAAVKAEAQGFALDQFRWIVPLTKEYTLIGEAEMEGVYFSALKENGTSVLLDIDGKEIDQTQGAAAREEKLYSDFDYIYEFDGEYALARKNDRAVAVNRKGEIVYQFQVGPNTSVNQIEGKLFGEDRDGKYRMIDISDGKIVKEWKSIECSELHKRGTGVYRAEKGYGEYEYLMNSDFEVLYDGKLFADTAERYSDGLLYVEWIVNGNWKEVPDDSERQIKCGYIDYRGDMVVETPGSIYGGEFSDGKALVYGSGRVWCVDKKGRTLFELPLKKEMVLDTYNHLNSTLNLTGYILPGCKFKDGVAPLYDGEKMGLIDEKGNWVIEPVFDDMDILSWNRIAVEYRGKWGVFDGGSVIRKVGL